MNRFNSRETGSARIKFILVMGVICALAFVAYKMVPVFYQAYLFKDYMQHNVDVAAAQGYQPDWVRDQLSKSLGEYSVPSNALITPANHAGRLEVRVQFKTPVEFPGYTYEYQFDHTARSTTFLSIK
jgi:hypothetical protein